MKSANRELLDRLAAEYVLGTLRGRARRRFERWFVSPQVVTLVKAWEDRLAGLEPPLEKVAPPTSVWLGIETKLELRKLAAAPALRWLPCGRRGRVLRGGGLLRAAAGAGRGAAAHLHVARLPAGGFADYLLARRGARRPPGDQPARAKGARPAAGQVARTLGLAGGWRAGVAGSHAAYRGSQRVLTAAQREAWPAPDRSPSASRPRADPPRARPTRCCWLASCRRPDSSAARPTERCETVLNPVLTSTPIMRGRPRPVAAAPTKVKSMRAPSGHGTRGIRSRGCFFALLLFAVLAAPVGFAQSIGTTPFVRETGRVNFVSTGGSLRNSATSTCRSPARAPRRSPGFPRSAPPRLSAPICTGAARAASTAR